MDISTDVLWGLGDGQLYRIESFFLFIYLFQIFPKNENVLLA